MKIALFDTNNHPTPILKEWGFGFADLGHNVTFFPIEQYPIRVCINQEFDLIVYVGPITPSDFEDIKKTNYKTIIVYATDCYRNEFAQYHGLIDYFITTQHKNDELTNKFHQMNFKLLNVPLAGNNHYFYPHDKNNLYDVCFIGTLAHGDRNERHYLYPLLDNNAYKTYLAGMTYNGKGNPFLPYPEANVIRNSSKVNINFHYDYQIENKGNPLGRVDLNQSVYNIALAGAFQVCDHPLAAELFNNAIILANKENWCDVVDYYVHNDNVREELAIKSYEIAIEKHTWKARMKEFLEMIEA
jgi:hypothetical protein